MEDILTTLYKNTTAVRLTADLDLSKLSALSDAVREAAAFAAMTLREFGETVAQWSASVSSEWRGFVREQTPDDVPEPALREYALRLNMRRRWRKVNWRRLNSNERAAAYWDWYSRRGRVTMWHTTTTATTRKTA